MPNYVQLPSYNPGQGADFTSLNQGIDSIGNALAKRRTDDNNRNTTNALARGDYAGAQASTSDPALALNIGNAQRQNDAASEDLLSKRIDRVGGIAQMALTEKDPAKRAQIMQSMYDSHPGLSDHVAKFGFDPNDHTSTANFLAAEAQKYRDPLDRDFKQAQTELARSSASLNQQRGQFYQARADNVGNPGVVNHQSLGRWVKRGSDGTPTLANPGEPGAFQLPGRSLSNGSTPSPPPGKSYDLEDPEDAQYQGGGGRSNLGGPKERKLPSSMESRLPAQPEPPPQLSESELQDYWTQVHGMPPPGKANQYGYDKNGKVYSRIDAAKKDTKAEEFAPILDDVRDAGFILAGKKDASGKVVGGVSTPYRNLANVAGGWVGGSDVAEATSAIEHAVQVFGTMARGANHAEKVDQRNLKFFVPSAWDSQEMAGFKADQLHRMMSAYIGATDNAERGRVFRSAMGDSIAAAKKKYGAQFLDSSLTEGASYGHLSDDEIKAKLGIK